MNEEKKTVMYYEAPAIEVLEVEVEKGFATSNTANTGLEEGDTSDWQWE